MLITALMFLQSKARPHRAGTEQAQEQPRYSVSGPGRLRVGGLSAEISKDKQVLQKLLGRVTAPQCLC